MTKISKKLASEMYSSMYKIRRFEEEVFEFYKNGQMAGLAHLYIGEEAVAAGACAAIKEHDYIGSTHRGHGHLVARGADMGRMMAEILGKETGYSKGKGGSMHIMAMDLGILGANGIVGGGIPTATGAAYSAKYRGTDQVALSFFGDGASNEGTFHECINMAAAWDLPIVYIIENNLYGITVDSRRVTKEHDLAKRAIGYGIPGYTIDGSDVEKVYETVLKAVTHARQGKGPSIVECKTYRYFGHNVSDNCAYRPKCELEIWKKKDAMSSFKEKGYLSEDEIKSLEKSIDAQIEDAVKFALDSPYPKASELMEDIFVD